MPDDALVTDQICTAVTGGVAHITITRPEAGNSLTGAMRDHLADTFDELSATLGVRAIVLTGAGERHFCTGAGLGGPPPAEPPRPEGAPGRTLGDVSRLIRHGWQRLVASVLDCEKPVIAAVNGTAAGGGANLVLACDLVVMAESARLIEVFVQRGIIPDAGGAYLLPRIVGPQRAKELMFLGDDCPAAEADRIGLVNRVVPAAELDAAVDELAARFLSLPTKAIAMTKRLANRSFESSREQSFDDEAFFQDLVATSGDMAEGMTAFRERRAPEFKGW